MQDSDPRIDALYEKLRKHWDASTAWASPGATLSDTPLLATTDG
jgi:hypothetical protein